MPASVANQAASVLNEVEPRRPGPVFAEDLAGDRRCVSGSSRERLGARIHWAA
jgi:hypothetical protein